MVNGKLTLARQIWGMTAQAPAKIFDPVAAARSQALFSALGANLVDALVAVAIVAMLLISAMVLYHWGSSYEAPAGSVIEKLHPGSWIVFAAFALSLLGSGNPIRYLDDMVSRQPGVLAFFLTFLVALFQLTVIQRVGFTALVDTFLTPMLLMALLLRMKEGWKRFLAWFMHGFFVVNALLGVYEYLSGWRLTPYVAGTVLIEDDWRSTALLGHPLANAIVTGSYIVAIGVGGARELPVVARGFTLAVQFAGMAAFGGRTSLILSGMFAGVAGARALARVIGGAPVSLAQAGGAALGLPLALAGLAGLIQSGFFDRLVERFADDNGSAHARIVMLHLFDLISFTDLLLGPDQAYIHSLQVLEGIEAGLESFWLATILGYGLIVSLIFFAGLFAFLYELIKAARPGAYQVQLFFFLVASTSVSLSAKTHVFSIIVAIMLVLLRKRNQAAMFPRQVARSAAAGEPSPAR